MSVRSVFGVLWLGGVLVCQAAGQDPALSEAARLDSEQKCGDAERIYQQLLTKGSPSSALVNNLGNHYLACGAPDKARVYFERLLKMNPAHVNANLQLARLAIARKEGAQALEYLSRIKVQDPGIVLVRAEALAQAGQREAAVAALEGLAKTAGADPGLLFALGMTYGRMGLYERAEAEFNAVLAQDPGDYDVLYNLGLAASRAGHYDRARSAFEVALKVRPGDVDTLAALGRVESRLGDYTRAVYLLSQARKLAPRRPDVLLSLAEAAHDAGYFGDSLLAYDEYLKLRPGDDVARRDRAFILGYGDAGRAEGLKELTAYVQRHPNDAIGYFDLAQISYHADRMQALEQVSTAVRLNPSFEPAHFVRGWLLHFLGREEEALADLQIAIRLNPRDALAFDQLGLVYMNLDRPADAQKALRQAAAILPNQPLVLLHLARALAESGHPEEAQPFFDRFRKVQPQGPQRPREEAGIIESATLTPAERSSRAIERLRQLILAAPNDPSLRLDLGSLLLADGKAGEAGVVFRELLALNPPGTILEKAGSALLAHEQYGLAGEMLERAASETPSALLDLAMAVFYSEGPKPALKILEKVPEGVDRGDYLLMKAKILDAAGQAPEADRTIEEGLRYAISRPRLAEESALLLVGHNQAAKALELIGGAMRSTPDDAGLMLAKAVALSALKRNAEAGKVVKEIEGRWPEWDRAYVIEGLLLERESKLVEARRSIRIALALGTRDPAAQCALARMTASAPLDAQCSCQPGIYEPFFGACKNP
ncbi:MAG: tetratricopeptide repeat protein [Bryobacteraceae bacterium]|jgi:tetratricopeptide (TPR) repeat protein